MNSAKKTHENHVRRWQAAASVILAAQLALEGVLFVSLVKAKIIPDKYIMVVLVVLALLLCLTAALMFIGLHHHHTKGRTVRRIIAVILAAVVGGVSVWGSWFLSKTDETIEAVSSHDNTAQAVVGVYVLADDSAEKIDDTADYTFGIMETMDRNNTDQAVEKIDAALGKNITTSSYASMVEEGKALYNHDVQAIILNEAFTDALKETDEFSDFDEHARLIYEVNIEKEEAPAAATPAQDSITTTPFIMYISGSDTRSQMLDVSRSDVNILMVVNPVTKQILLLNTPRDYYVANPAGGGTLDKLTHLGLYGVNNSMEGLAQLYGTTVDQYMQINFTGFETLIDAIGGITVNSDVAFSDGSYSYVVGENQMDGAKALAFARNRYQQAAGDNDRGRHQMMVIEAVLQKMTSNASTILTRYGDIMNSLSGMFVTSLSSDQISSLVQMQLNDMASWNVKSYAVTGTGGSDYTYSMPSVTAYVMYQNPDMVAHASALIQKVENGETLTDEDVQ